MFLPRKHDISSEVSCLCHDDKDNVFGFQRNGLKEIVAGYVQVPLMSNTWLLRPLAR